MITDQTTRKQYNISSSVPATFSFEFWWHSIAEFFAALTLADGSIALLTYGTDYELSDPGEGGTLTRLSDWPPGATALTLYRQTPLTQETDFRNGDASDAETHEAAHDRTVAMLQEGVDLSARSLHGPATDPETLVYELPEVAARAGQFATYNAEGEPSVATGMASSPVSAYMEPLVASADRAALLAGIDISAEDVAAETNPATTTTTAQAVLDALAEQIQELEDNVRNKMYSAARYVPLLALALGLSCVTSPLTDTVSIGPSPSAYMKDIIFDGTDIWSANNTDGTVVRINPDTMSIIATVYGCTKAHGLCFDGEYIWCTNSSAALVYKISRETNAIAATITVGNAPRCVCTDGAYIYTANSGSDTVSKINKTTNAVVATLAVGNGPFGLCYDGTHLWCANISDGTLSKILVSSFTVIATISLGPNQQPQRICFDGIYIWGTNWSSEGVWRINAQTNEIQHEPEEITMGVCFTGKSIYYTCDTGDILRYDAISGKEDKSYEASIGLAPEDIAFDGTYLWVSEVSRVQKILAL